MAADEWGAKAAMAASYGRRAEGRVAELLRAQGFRIVERNLRVGRAEIDIVARRNRVLVFCEVRARRDRSFVSPLATLDAAKLARLRAAARRWLTAGGWRGETVRFDVASVTGEDDEMKIEYVEDAF